MNVSELKVGGTASAARAVKALRKFCPQASISEPCQIIEAKQPFFFCQAGSLDWKRKMLCMVRAMDSGRSAGGAARTGWRENIFPGIKLLPSFLCLV